MILLTGAAGFIGYQTAKRLQEMKLPFIAVDELEFFGSRVEHQDLKIVRTVAPAEILEESFYRALADAGTPVSGIIHLGACTDTTEMRLDYLDRVNLHYTQSLWTLSTQFKIPFVYASSAATYGGGENGYDDEESQIPNLKPLNPYGDSKQNFDLWALEQEKQGKTPPLWSGFKFFNVYGFGERHKTKMASVVFQGFEQIRSKGQLKLFKSHKSGIADGEQKRDFVYVEDVVNVLLFALQKPIHRGIFNLGSGQDRSFLDLAKATFAALGKTPQIEFIDTPIEIRERYQYFTQANMQKLLEEEGYPRQFTVLEDGVRLTVQALLSHERFRS